MGLEWTKLALRSLGGPTALTVDIVVPALGRDQH